MSKDDIELVRAIGQLIQDSFQQQFDQLKEHLDDNYVKKIDCPEKHKTLKSEIHHKYACIIGGVVLILGAIATVIGIMSSI